MAISQGLDVFYYIIKTPKGFICNFGNSKMACTMGLVHTIIICLAPTQATIRMVNLMELEDIPVKMVQFTSEPSEITDAMAKES